MKIPTSIGNLVCLVALPTAMIDTRAVVAPPSLTSFNHWTILDEDSTHAPLEEKKMLMRPIS